MSEAHPLLEAYLNGELDDQGFAELNDWLREDPEHLRQWAVASFMSHELGEALAEQVAADRPPTVLDKAGAAERGVMDAEVLRLLEQIDALGQAQPVTLLGELSSDDRDEPKGHLAHDFAVVGGYVLRKALTNKKLIKTGVCSVAAAILLLVLVLVNPFAGDDPDPVVLTPESHGPSPVHPYAGAHAVATLTGVHDAQWLGPVPSVGDPLTAGQRFELTAGFVQITTRRGAEALLQGPAMIELIDSPNAIRLHHGKLVGICETPSSKGFLVRTPHMDVHDLGTRFGVVVSEQASRTRVIEGEVEVRSTRLLADDVPTRLLAGQAAAVDAGGDPVVRMQAATDRFAHHWQAIVNTPDLVGPIRYEASIPTDLRVGASKDKEVRLFYERSGVVLDRGVQVNVLEPGRYIGDDLFKRETLSNVTADSYLVHFDSDLMTDEIAHRTVTIRFDRPILGVITASAQLVSSHDELGLPGVRYGNQSDWAAVDPFTNRDGSGLDVSKNQASIGQDDAIQLSDDRQTLTLDLFTVTAIDQVRVLVQSKIQDQ